MKWFSDSYDLDYEYKGKLTPFKFRKELNTIMKTWEQIGSLYDGSVRKYIFIKDRNGWLRYRLEVAYNIETNEVVSRKFVRTLDIEDLREKEAWAQ